MTFDSNHTGQSTLKSLSLALWRIRRTRENLHQENVHRQLSEKQHDGALVN